MNAIARRTRVLAACAAVALLTTVLPPATDAQDLEDWQRDELRGLLEAINAAVEGEIVPDTDPFELQPDFLKGTDGNAYVPFTLSIDAAKVESPMVSMYLFVAEPGDEDAIFEDAYFASVTPGDDDRVRISRAFTAPGGAYDVYVAIQQSMGEESDDDDRGPVMLLRQRVDVPDLWDGRLQLSTLILPEVVEPLAAPLTPDEQILSPYSLGATRIIPKFDQEFAKQAELSLIFLVYNPGLADGSKPDITIEYTFHLRSSGGEEYFNRTNPQQFNGQTLPAAFDVTLGHQIVAGQTVPLSLFPAGDYRLEIKVTDNTNSAEIIENLMFTVLET
ncbi:MAG: hypothetical protein J4G16_05350 [Acidobacteria bacterium]|nr:hypothetical protein [Acidobacteriota bacterium]MCY4635321.1 hypothetical protein [Acidobacteriota bacterium]